RWLSRVQSAPAAIAEAPGSAVVRRVEVPSLPLLEHAAGLPLVPGGEGEGEKARRPDAGLRLATSSQRVEPLIHRRRPPAASNRSEKEAGARAIPHRLPDPATSACPGSLSPPLPATGSTRGPGA